MEQEIAKGVLSFSAGLFFGWIVWRCYYLGVISELDFRSVEVGNKSILRMLKSGCRPVLRDDGTDFYWLNDGK